MFAWVVCAVSIIGLHVDGVSKTLNYIRQKIPELHFDLKPTGLSSHYLLLTMHFLLEDLH